MKKIVTICIACMYLFCSCENGPKVITSDQNNSEPIKSTGVFSSLPDSDDNATSGRDVKEGFHEVIVKEILKTSKYVYMHVDENGEDFWVATGLKDIEIGEKYLYKDGLLKTNFVSKEFNRTFDKVYLVSNVIPAKHSENNESSKMSVPSSISKNEKVIHKQGSVKIKDLVDHPEKYQNKEIQITARCTKLNANIMGKNWMHFQDGTKDDFDLVLTSAKAIPEGHVVTMKAKVVLDKDFGAGYKYGIILEEGEIVR